MYGFSIYFIETMIRVERGMNPVPMIIFNCRRESPDINFTIQFYIWIFKSFSLVERGMNSGPMNIFNCRRESLDINSTI